MSVHKAGTVQFKTGDANDPLGGYGQERLSDASAPVAQAL